MASDLPRIFNIHKLIERMQPSMHGELEGRRLVITIPERSFGMKLEDFLKHKFLGLQSVRRRDVWFSDGIKEDTEIDRMFALMNSKIEVYNSRTFLDLEVENPFYIRGEYIPGGATVHLKYDEKRHLVTRKDFNGMGLRDDYSSGLPTAWFLDNPRTFD